MNAAHKVGKLRNRLNRLKRQVKEAVTGRKGMMEARMRELEEMLHGN